MSLDRVKSYNAAHMELGNLKPMPAQEHTELIAQPVLQALQALANNGVQVTEIDPTLSDTAAFCAHYDFPLSRSANCIVLRATRAGREWYVACAILATTRADINGAVRKALDARKVSFAPMDLAVAETGMEFGAITPVGLPPSWELLIDKRVIDAGQVIIGSGLRKSKLVLEGTILATLPNARVIDGLAQENL